MCECIYLVEMTLSLRRMEKSKPYYYVRFRWSNGVDMKEAAKELGENFGVETLIPPTGDVDPVLFKEHREELKVAADTLKAFLSPKRAVLFQSKTARFTERDMELRRRILELYPRGRITPFPFFPGSEPKFEVAE